MAETWWLAPQHLWMKQRHTRKGQRQEVADILMVARAFVKLSPPPPVFPPRGRRHGWPPLRGAVPAEEDSKSKPGKRRPR